MRHRPRCWHHTAWLVFWLAALSSLAPAQAVSSFTVGKTPDGERLLIQWPEEIAQWILKSNSGLHPSGWTAVSHSPTLNGGVYSLELPVSGTTRFYRLESESLIFVDAANPSVGVGSRLNPYRTIQAAMIHAQTRFQTLGTPQSIYVFEGDYTSGVVLNGASHPGLTVNIMDSSVAIAIDGELVGGGGRARISPGNLRSGIEVSNVSSFSLTGFEISTTNAPAVTLTDVTTFGAEGTCVTSSGGPNGISLRNIAGGSARFSTVSISNTTGAGIEIVNVGGRFEVDDQDPDTFFDVATISNTGSSDPALVIEQSTGQFRFVDLAITDPQSIGIKLDHAGEVELFGGSIDGSAGDAINSLNTNLKTEFISIGIESAITGDGFSIRNSDAVDRVFESVNDSVFGASGKGWVIESTGAGTLSAEVIAPFDLTGTDNCIFVRGGALQDSLRLAVWGFSFTAGSGLPAIDVGGAVPGSVVMKRFDQGQATSNLGVATGAVFSGVTFDADPDLPGIQPVIGTGEVFFGSHIPPGIPAEVQRLRGDVLSFLNCTGDLRFARLDIGSRDGTALLADSTGAAGPFALHVAAGTIDVNNGAALDLRGIFSNIRFSHLISRQSPTSGVLINGVAGSLIVDPVFVVSQAGGPAVSVANSPDLITNIP